MHQQDASTEATVKTAVMWRSPSSGVGRGPFMLANGEGDR